MTAIEGLKVIPLLSLAKFDQCWQETFAGSVAGRVWTAIGERGHRALSPGLEMVGSFLQLVSFWVVMALTIALGMRQFANDKEGLALFVIAGIGLRFLGAVLGGKERYRANAIDAIVLSYLASNIIAACASHYMLASLKGLAKLLVFVAGYFLFRGAVGQSRRRMIMVTAGLVAAGVLVSLYGLYQYKIGVAPLATWEDPTVEVKGTRIFSTLGNPNLLAGYLVPLVPLSFSLAIIAAWSRRLWLALPLLTVTGVIAVAVILTGSRGGYIGLAGSAVGLAAIVGTWLWREKPRARAFIILALLMLAILIALAVHFVPTVEQRVASIFAGGEHTSNRYRMNVWLSSLRMFKDSWWFGVGPGNQAFELAYGLYMTTGFDALGTYCLPLEVAVEAGMLGLASFGALVVTGLARAHLNFYTTTDGGLRWLLAGSTSAIFGMMAHGLVDTVFFRPQVQFVFWILVALVVTAPKSEQGESGSG